LLWTITEKKFKENARAERIAKLKNEVCLHIFVANLCRLVIHRLYAFVCMLNQKSALKAMSQMEGFAGAMSSINRRRRELNKVLDIQEEEGLKR
jgi:hypothetical protein